jgi:hypothetical protein
MMQLPNPERGHQTTKQKTTECRRKEGNADRDDAAGSEESDLHRSHVLTHEYQQKNSAMAAATIPIQAAEILVQPL